jgi:hypothetical protein
MRICDLHVGHSLVQGTFDPIIYCCCKPMTLTGNTVYELRGS